MNNSIFIKAIKSIFNDAKWYATNSQTEDTIKSLEILNAKKIGYNTLSLLIKENYHYITDCIRLIEIEDKLPEQEFNMEFAKRLAPFVAKHILKRYLKVSGKDMRCKKKNAIVLNLDFSKTIYFTNHGTKSKS